MKILYAVQATGNGHISRATQLLPYMEKYGEVDVFLSGSNCDLATDLPVKYRSKGMSFFYNKNGGLDYLKTAKHVTTGLKRIISEVRSLPVEKYDVVINDFESITSLSCAFKKVASVNFGHQASFQSSFVPRPANKEFVGETVLKNYARASQYIGLHFKSYDDFIFEPVVKKEILEASPVNDGHITVYLSAYHDEVLIKYFRQVPHVRFHVFSKQVKQKKVQDNVTFIPVQQAAFNESMIHSMGVITGAGFETPAEVMHLQKKLMVIPIKGQYEQYCNAAALDEFGVKVLQTIDENFVAHINQWLESYTYEPVSYTNVIPEVLQHLFESYSPEKHLALNVLPDFRQVLAKLGLINIGFD
ncbi:glycosyltransferase family protein [Chitinophagaceae bacterium 26-R-25]|nr:glycosyltransferase family protein [Chitinophagaceae bacterium 26-R-25]